MQATALLAHLRYLEPWNFIVISLLSMTLAMAQHEPANSQPTLVQVAGGKIEVTLPDEPMTLSVADLLNWIKNAAGAVSTYYGRFPVTHLSLRIRAGSGSGVRHGVTYPTDGGLILITVGRDATTQVLADDWVLAHEMIHLAFPSMADEHHWIEEGISTYVEPVARAQAGRLPVAEVWKEFIRDMPKGQPGFGDAGLDHTPTWGRTYWGGAMFCLVADVRIRERTGNRKGLRDALRAVMEHGGTISEDWKIEKALAIGDKATGTGVLQELYQEMRNKPSPVDLDQLWNKLGVSLKAGEVQFDDKAQEAAIRKAITSDRAIAP